MKNMKNKGRMCLVDGCKNSSSTKGYCNFHYHRLWKYGSLQLEKPRHGPEKHRKFGTGHITSWGYLNTQINGKPQYDHVRIAEKALGKKLPAAAKIHHVDGNGLNNHPHNLVICPSQAYHLLLHQRQRAFDACGHANWLKCQYCKKYDTPVNLSIIRTSYWHKECRNKHRRDLYAKDKKRNH